MANQKQINKKNYKQQPKKKQQVKKKQQPVDHKKAKALKPDIPAHWSFPKLDSFFHKYLLVFFFISIFLTIIFGAYLFDLKISEGGDDSDYIVAAKRFLEGKSFPTWHGSLYPILLSFFVAIFGINLFVLKLVSFICIIAHVAVFFYAFRKTIAPTFLVLTMLILAVNSHVLYYASQTYSEAFFMLLQILLVWTLFKIMDVNAYDKFKVQLDYWKRWLFFGLLLFFIYQTRNIGIAMLIAVLLFFMIKKKYVHALFSFAGFLVFSIPFKIYKNVVWKMNEANLRGQFELMFYKNPYNLALGKEDFSGMVTRVVENAKIFLSRQLMIILGFRQEGSKETNLFLAILIIALLLLTLILVYKRNRKIFFILLYTIIGIGATFVSLHALWGQPRLILIYVPFILVSLAWLAHFLSKEKQYRFFKFIMLGLFGFMFFKTLSVTGNKIGEHEAELKENLSGNKYYGFTPDWMNFLALSEWAGKNLPDTAVIASRKPSMSFIYSNGREFHGIYKLPTMNVDQALKTYDEKFNEVTIINLNDLIRKEVPMNIQFTFHRQNLAYVYNSEKIFGIFHLDVARQQLIEILKGHGVSYWKDIHSLETTVENQGYSAVSPDSLVYKLKSNSVDYIIRGSLRVDPRRKTDRTINTIERYIYFTEFKYPGIFEQVNQIGSEEGEPAYLFRIDYSKYNIR
jgi:hypothetical protein